MSGESFAEQVRRLRRDAGLTQEELAERAGLSARGISDLERGVKRRPHPETVRLLAAALDLSAADLAALRSAANQSSQSPQPLRSSLPASMTTLLGRDDEVWVIGTLMQPGQGVRLVTLTGPGGVGKTRLSLQVAQEVQERFADGATFVSLASLDDPRQVLVALAQAVGSGQLSDRPALEQVTRLLADRTALVVLDNFEHLLPAAPEVADVLSACPGVVVLATSRAPLRLAVEIQIPVGPLALPDAGGDGSPESLLRSPAVQLFVRQAHQVLPTFALDTETAPSVSAICTGLEGLPLSLELAAVRLKALSSAELAEVLEHRLGVLTGGPRDRPARHQTLRATIGWSYDLLDEGEQAALRQLAVFANGATRQAAAAVLTSGDDLAVVDVLEALLDQSLLQRREDAAGGSRYAMLETIREFALERLAASGEESNARDRHAAWFLDFAEQGERELTGPHQAIWMKHLAADYDNLRTAIGWYVDRADAERSQRMGSALWRYWAASGRLREAHDWLDRAIALDPEAVTVARGNALLRAGNVAVDLADFRLAQACYEQSQQVFTTLGDEVRATRALDGLGLVLYYRGQYAQAREAHERTLRLWRERGWRPGAALALQNLASCALAEEDYDLAQTLLTESGFIRESLADTEGLGWSLCWQGRLARRAGDRERVPTLLSAAMTAFEMSGHVVGCASVTRELAQFALDAADYRLALVRYLSALNMFDEGGDVLELVENLEGIATVAVAQNECEHGTQLTAWSTNWRLLHDAHRTPALQRTVDWLVIEARAFLGERSYQHAWDIGEELNMDEAIALASSISLP